MYPPVPLFPIHQMLSGRPGLASLQKNIQVHLERLQAEDLGIPLSSDIRGRAAKDEEPPRQLSNSLEGFPNCFLSSSVNLPASGIGQTDTPVSLHPSVFFPIFPLHPPLPVTYLFLSRIAHVIPSVALCRAHAGARGARVFKCQEQRQVTPPGHPAEVWVSHVGREGGEEGKKGSREGEDGSFEPSIGHFL